MNRTRAFAIVAAGVLLVLAQLSQAAAANSPGAAAAKAAPDWTVPSDADIRNILVERIDAQHQGVGIVVGVIDAEGRRIVAYGARDQGDTRPLNGQTMFEIGSMTKVFTSLLLADAVRRGEVALDDPVAKYLPSGVIMPTRGGKQITLVDLATHTSGLPRMPNNFTPKDPSNPYADYSVEQMYQFLGGYQLTRDIGSQYEYSNLGGGLLGHVLALRAGMDYGALVKARITGPLGMDSTAITLSPQMQARLAAGHDASLSRVANWDLPTLAGAGALRSDADDILTFLGAELGYVDTPLKPAMAAQITAVRRPTGTPNLDVALAWHILTTPKGEIVWHNGGTGGYRTFMGFDARRGVGVVVLTNASTAAGGDDIGFHLLTGSHLAPPPAPPSKHTAISLSPEALEPFVGRYQFAPQVFLTVTRDGGHLFAQLTGQPAYEIFPESPTAFFFKVADAQISFQIGADGRVTRLALHQNGRDVPGKRVAAP